MSKIIVDQLQAPGGLPFNVPATPAGKFIGHTTNGTMAQANTPRTRIIQYNYADTGAGVASVDIPLILNTKKIVSLRINGSYNPSALDANNVLAMDLLNGSDATVITAGSVNMASGRIRTTQRGNTLNGSLSSQNFFGLLSSGTSNGNAHQFRGTITFKSNNSEFYAQFLQNCRESAHSVELVCDATGTITSFPEKLRINFASSNSGATRISITPTYEP